MKRNKIFAFFAIVAMMLVSLTACNIDLNTAKLQIKTPAIKTVYEIGEEFSAVGMIVGSEDAAGIVLALTDDLYVIDSSAFDKTKAGTYTIIIKLKADETKTVEYTVTVLAPNVASEIKINDSATQKITYEIGEAFTSVGLSIEKTMRDDVKVICDASEYTIDSSLFDNTKAGTYTITIKLKADETKTAEYTVTVLAANVATEIKIKDNGTQKLTYEIGDEFSFDGLIIEKTMSRDGSKVICSIEEYIVNSSLFDNTKAGTYKITIKLKADETKTAEYTVTVLAPNVVNSIAIKSTSTHKTVYEISEAFAPNGLIIEKTMSRGNKVICEANEYVIDSSSFNNMVSAKYNITIKLRANEEITTNYDVTVSAAKVASISIKTPANKLIYEIGETFNAGELVVNKLLTDNNTTVCALSEYTIDSSLFDNTKAGTYTITIKLKADETKTAEYTVTVLAANVATEIKIKDNGTQKLIYEIGDEFSFDGLIIEKTMSRDGSKVICSIDEYIVNSSLFDNTKAGTYTITIKLKADETKTAEYTVTVLAANVATKIIIKDNGTQKLTYEIGDEFSFDGLIIEKTMSRDGSKVICSIDEYIVNSSLFDNTKAGTYTITIKLKADETKTAEYTVTVLAANVATEMKIKDTSTQKIKFFAGDEFTSAGLIIEKTMSRDGSKVICMADEYIVDSSLFISATPGTYDIIIKLKADESITARYTVTVNAIAEYVGKYYYNNYKSGLTELAIEILPDGTANVFSKEYELDILIFSCETIALDAERLLLNFTFERLQYNSGYLIVGWNGFSGVYSNGKLSVDGRYFMCGEYSKKSADMKSVEVVTFGKRLVTYFFIDEFVLDGELFGLGDHIKAGRIGVFADANGSISVDTTAPITVNTTLYIMKIDNPLEDDSYKGIYLMPLTMTQDPFEIMEGAPMIFGDTITYNGMQKEYIAEKVGDKFILTTLGNGVKTEITYDENLKTYIFDTQAIKIDASKYITINIGSDEAYDGPQELTIRKGKPISDAFFDNLGLILTFVKGDLSTKYNGEILNEGDTLYLHSGIIEEPSFDFLDGKSFSAGVNGEIYFGRRGNKSFEWNKPGEAIYGVYNCVLDESRLTISFALENGSPFAIGIYNLLDETLIVTIDGVAIEFAPSKYADHILNIHEKDVRFSFPINVENIGRDCISFDIFGYVHEGGPGGNIIGIYEITYESVNGTYALTVTFGDEWQGENKIQKGYYDEVRGNLVLHDIIYYRQNQTEYHPIEKEGMVSKDCYDKDRNQFSLWWSGHIQIFYNETVNQSNKNPYYAMLTGIREIGKGIYEIDFIISASETNVDLTKIIANVLDKTYTVTIGGTEYVFTIPPYADLYSYGIIGGILGKKTYRYENKSFDMNVFGEYVYADGATVLTGKYEAVGDVSHSERIDFKFFDADGKLLYNAFYHYMVAQEILFVTIGDQEYAFSSRQNSESYPELYGSYKSEVGATDTIVLNIVDDRSFNLTINDNYMYGAYIALQYNGVYSFDFTIEGLLSGRMYAEWDGTSLVLTYMNITYTLVKGESTTPENPEQVFRDKLDNEVRLMPDKNACSLILYPNSEFGTYKIVSETETEITYALDLGIGVIIATHEIKSGMLTFEHKGNQYALMMQ